MTLLQKHEIRYMKENRSSKMMGKKVEKPIDIGYGSNEDASAESAAGISVLLPIDKTKIGFLVEPKPRMVANTELYFHYWPNP